MKNNFKFTKKEILVIIFLSLVYVFGILIFTGTFFSGYHLVDDHEIIRIVYGNRSNSASWVSKIFTGFPWIGGRFRPLYSFLRLVRCVVFGDNFYLWSAWVGLEVSFSIVFAYFIARMFRCNKYMSFLFGVIIVTGEQSATWWRLGPQEPTGILLLMLTIFLLLNYQASNKRRWLIIGLVSALLTSWAKESFTLILPFIPFLVIGYDVYINETEAPSLEKYRYSIKKNALVLLFCLGVFLINVLSILTKVGTNLAGYAGVDSSLGILGYIRRMGGMVLFRFSIYFWGMIIVAIGCFIYVKLKHLDIRKLILKNGFLLLVCLGIIFIQLILHVKSGMHERYFIPTTVAVGFITIIVVKDIIGESKKCIKVYEFMLTLSMLGLLLTTVFPMAREFAVGGKELATCFEDIQIQVTSDSIIMTDLDAECNYAIETYLEYKLGYSGVVSYEANEFINRVNLDNKEITINSVDSVEYIIGSETKVYDDFILIGDYDTIKLWKNAEL